MHVIFFKRKKNKIGQDHFRFLGLIGFDPWA